MCAAAPGPGAVGSTQTASSSDDVERIEVRGQRSLRDRETPEAATRIRFERFELEAADLGEILARQEGVVLQRRGGLGSEIRLSLNGLSGDAVRFFIDGIPLDLGGLPAGIANIPLGIIDELVVHRGVVPTRLGADALGGAIELVTRAEFLETKLSASYVAGSFGTHRVAVTGSHVFDDDGFFVRAYGFFDAAENDYDIDAPVIDASGRDTIESLPRFNDDFESYGGSAEVGWAEHPSFGTLTLRGYYSRFTKGQPTDTTGSIAIGEVERSVDVVGGVLRFDIPIDEQVSFAGNLGLARAERSFLDVSNCIYNFLGDCARTQPQGVAGELGDFASDLAQTNLSTFLRATLEWEVADDHTLRLSAAPTLTFSSGDQREPLTGGIKDPGEADRRLLTAVAGVDYELRLFDERLTTVVFGKGYAQQGETDVIAGMGVAGTNTFDSLDPGGGVFLRW
ncbi:MAG: TonB-dependent receptor plug domain-containing protein, partial [Myxococcota bacterium]